MNGTYFLFGVLGLTAIIVAYYVSKEFEKIAEMKGYYDRRYFWWTFLLGAVGMLMVIALPDKSERVVRELSSSKKLRTTSPVNVPASDELPDL